VRRPDDLKLRGDKLGYRGVLPSRSLRLDRRRRLYPGTQYGDPMARRGIRIHSDDGDDRRGALPPPILNVEASPYGIAEDHAEIEGADSWASPADSGSAHGRLRGASNTWIRRERRCAPAGRDDEPLATIEPLVPSVRSRPCCWRTHDIQHHSGTVHKSPPGGWLAAKREIGGTTITDRPTSPAWHNAPCSSALNLGLGALMNENHRLVAELGAVAPANDTIDREAASAGSLMARNWRGAGGGGTTMF